MVDRRQAVDGGTAERESPASRGLTEDEWVAEIRKILGDEAPGVRLGDRLVVTGALGASAGGLRLAEAEPEVVRPAIASDWGRALLAAHVRPQARVGEGQTLCACGATAMIDVSDGLALDLTRLCRESGVGAVLQLARLPVSPARAKLAKVIA